MFLRFSKSTAQFSGFQEQILILAHVVFLKTIFLPPQTPAHRYVETLNKWPTNERHFSNVWRGV